MLLLLDLSVEEDFSYLDPTSTDEGYSLRLDPPSGGLQRASAAARTWYGLHHAMETLSQLISWNAAEGSFQVHSEAAVDDDRPAYPHRGISVDTSRNFMPVSVLKELIDGLGQVCQKRLDFFKLQIMANIKRAMILFPLRT